MKKIGAGKWELGRFRAQLRRGPIASWEIFEVLQDGRLIAPPFRLAPHCPTLAEAREAIENYMRIHPDP